ncbi:Rv3235 family protein [Actinoplanes sp. NPDC049599]|uniref:Rv3235 family protein n=1 Tax=Actinoplanes sp. NPDC049599 TaxID=3363903 RepID=UPI0037A2F073
MVTGASTEARLAVRRFVSTCIEVLNGYRPAAHLRRLSQPREAATVVAQGVAGARRVTEARQTRATGRSSRQRPAAVVRLQLCEPREGAVEAAAVVVVGDKTHAMVIRLERQNESWLATTFRLI